MDDNAQIVGINGQAFGAFAPVPTNPTSGQIQVPRDRSTCQQILKRISNQLIATYKKCNPISNWSGALARIVLTNPSDGVFNDGNDNVSHDLILYRNADVIEPSGRRYKIKEVLGKGIFGQVVKCYCEELDTHVAIKVIKNEPNYHRQAQEEIKILGVIKKKLNEKAGRKTIVEIVHHFEFQSHVCIVFDLMSINLYDLIRRNRFRGFSMTLVRSFTKQLLDAMVILRECKIIHADIKPENILLRQIGSPEITLIDFGSACSEGCTIYSYVQSRFYRSPEVIIGYPYNAAIDMWSLGCVSAELAVGWPLFPGPTEYNLLMRIHETIGEIPTELVRFSRKSPRFYKQNEDGECVLKTKLEMEEPPDVEARSNKRFFADTALEEIIYNYPYKSGMDEAEKNAEQLARVAFVDFLRGLLNTDPASRWTPQQAVCHPFITGEPFTGPFIPPQDSFDPPVGVLQGASTMAHTWSGGLHFGLNNPSFQPVQPQNFQFLAQHGAPGVHYHGGMRPTTTNIPFMIPQPFQNWQQIGAAGHLANQDPMASSVPRNLFQFNNSVLQYSQHNQPTSQGQQSFVPTITFRTNNHNSQSYNNCNQVPLPSVGSIAGPSSLGPQRTYDYNSSFPNYRSRFREEEHRNKSKKRRDTDQNTSTSSELTVCSSYESSLNQANTSNEHLSPRHNTNTSSIADGSQMDAQSTMFSTSGTNYDQAGILASMGNQYPNTAMSQGYVMQEVWNQMALALRMHPQGTNPGRASHENSEQSIQQQLLNQAEFSRLSHMSNAGSPEIDDEIADSEIDEDSGNSATESQFLTVEDLT